MIKRAFDIFSMHRYRLQGTDKMLEKNMEEDRPAEILIFLLKLRDNNSISIRDQRSGNNFIFDNLSRTFISFLFSSQF